MDYVQQVREWLRLLDLPFVGLSLKTKQAFLHYAIEAQYLDFEEWVADQDDAMRAWPVETLENYYIDNYLDELWDGDSMADNIDQTMTVARVRFIATMILLDVDAPSS